MAQSTYLWLGEHVQTPGADLAVRGHTDQVVGILGAHHVHTVHRVLARPNTISLDINADANLVVYKYNWWD